MEEYDYDSDEYGSYEEFLLISLLDALKHKNAGRRREEVIKLLRQGLDLNSKIDREYPLTIAITEPDIDADGVITLIKLGADYTRPVRGYRNGAEAIESFRNQTLEDYDEDYDEEDDDEDDDNKYIEREVVKYDKILEFIEHVDVEQRKLRRELVRNRESRGVPRLSTLAMLQLNTNDLRNMRDYYI